MPDDQKRNEKLNDQERLEILLLFLDEDIRETIRMFGKPEDIMENLKGAMKSDRVLMMIFPSIMECPVGLEPKKVIELLRERLAIFISKNEPIPFSTRDESASRN